MIKKIDLDFDIIDFERRELPLLLASTMVEITANDLKKSFASALFTALSNGKVSAFISFMRTFGLITVLLLVLPVYIGITGVWLAVPISEFLTMILSVSLTIHYGNKYKYL